MKKHSHINLSLHAFVGHLIIAFLVSVVGCAYAQDDRDISAKQTYLASISNNGSVDKVTTKTLRISGGVNTIGSSVEKRPIEATVFGNGNDTILILAGIHGDEVSSVEFAEQLKKELSSGSIKMATGSRCVLVTIANPDGYHKMTRTNARGVDVNRNFPTKNWKVSPVKNRYFGGNAPASEPETVAIMELINAVKPKIILSIHSPLKVVNYDGPAEFIAKRFAQNNKYPAKADIGYPTPGSLGTFTGKERNIPTITLELEVAKRQDIWSHNRTAIMDLLSMPVEDHRMPIPAKYPPKKVVKYKVSNRTENNTDNFEYGVKRVLEDQRGWSSSGVIFEKIVSGKYDFEVILADPPLADKLCLPLQTYGTWSCRSGNRIVINADRWTGGYWRWNGPLDEYQTYLINHEMGHALGLKHLECKENGRPAPVMMQQSKGIAGCFRNSWPREDELKIALNSLTKQKYTIQPVTD